MFPNRHPHLGELLSGFSSGLFVWKKCQDKFAGQFDLRKTRFGGPGRTGILSPVTPEDTAVQHPARTLAYPFTPKFKKRST
jgi:hypothetical protein